MDNIYQSGQYLKNNPTWHSEDSVWKAKQILKIISNNKLGPKSIAEVGCGAGGILEELHRQMPADINFFGYEISPQAYELCRPKEKERLNFYLKDLLTEKELHFDLIMAIDLFEHIEDYWGFLRQLHSKATYQIFHIPLDLSAQSVTRGRPILKNRLDVGHLHYFTKETALATLADTGYEIIDYFYTASAIDLKTKSFKSWLARWPRKLFYKISPDWSARLFGGYSLLVLTK